MDYENTTIAQCADIFTRIHSPSGYISIRDGKCVYSNACPESEIARDLRLPWKLYNYDGDCSKLSKNERILLRTVLSKLLGTKFVAKLEC